MKKQARSLGARIAAPLLAALDRRLAALAVRLEAHTTNLAADQTQRLDAIDQQVALDLRVVDEHLLAIERTTVTLRGAGAVGALPLGPFTEPTLLLVVPRGADEAVPEGYEVVEREGHANGTLLRLAPKS